MNALLKDATYPNEYRDKWPLPQFVGSRRQYLAGILGQRFGGEMAFTSGETPPSWGKRKKAAMRKTMGA